MLPEVSKSKKVSRFFWAAILFLIVAAFVVPEVDFSLQQDSPRADAATDPFGPGVREVEQIYHDEGLRALDPQRALDYAPLLQARALTEAGPVSAPEVVGAAEEIEAYRPQIAEQPDEGSRTALRNHRNELIVDQLNRVDDQKAIEALERVRTDYIEAFGVDPSYVAEMPEE